MNGKHSALYKFPSWEDSRDPGVSDAHAPITWTSKQFASRSYIQLCGGSSLARHASLSQYWSRPSL